MKRNLFLLVVLFFILGCSHKCGEQKVLAKINNYVITQDEFQQEFKDSVYGRLDTPQARQDFLNNLINRKLILQEAQSQGMDKTPSFLKTIEKFWEQSLLKIALDKKSKELAGTTQVTDREIEAAYKQMVKDGKATQTYEQMYAQVKWQLIETKESQAVNDWLESLRKKADIQINQEALKAK